MRYINIIHAWMCCCCCCCWYRCCPTVAAAAAAAAVGAILYFAGHFFLPSRSQSSLQCSLLSFTRSVCKRSYSLNAQATTVKIKTHTVNERDWAGGERERAMSFRSLLKAVDLCDCMKKLIRKKIARWEKAKRKQASTRQSQKTTRNPNRFDSIRVEGKLESIQSTQKKQQQEIEVKIAATATTTANRKEFFSRSVHSIRIATNRWQSG